MDTTALMFPLADAPQHKESRKEQLQRWQEEKQLKMLKDKASKKKPFVVGKPVDAKAQLCMSIARRKSLGITGSAKRVPLSAMNINEPASPIAPASSVRLRASTKDSRKNLTDVFHSNDMTVSSITDMLSMKLDFGTAAIIF